MNAMLEPRIVATRIQGRDSALQEAEDLPARSTATSHGYFMQTLFSQLAFCFRRDGGLFFIGLYPDPDIRRERRPPAPRECELPSHQIRRLLGHRPPPRPRTNSPLRAIHRHSLSLPPPSETYPPNLLIPDPKKLDLVWGARIPSHRRPGSCPELAD